MASPSDSKKAKIDKSCRDRNDIFSKFHSNRICCERLLESETLLDSNEHGFCLLKVKNCNADEAVRFSEAFCSVTRNVDQRDNRLTFQFVSLFEDGFKAIDLYLKNPEDVPTRKGERLALERLLEFLDKYSDYQKALTIEEKKGEKMTEIDWTLKLAHHLLSKLAANQNYTMDNHNRNKPSKCPCCLEPILGAYGDTSIGAEDGWHGCMDILLGIDQVSVTIAKEEELEDLPIGNEASFEIKLGGRFAIIQTSDDFRDNCLLFPSEENSPRL